jgi:hypothetical protein
LARPYRIKYLVTQIKNVTFVLRHGRNITPRRKRSLLGLKPGEWNSLVRVGMSHHSHITEITPPLQAAYRGTRPSAEGEDPRVASFTDTGAKADGEVFKLAPDQASPFRWRNCN